MKKASLAMTGLLLMMIASAYAYHDGDFQVWNTEAEEFKVNKDSKIALEQEFRWGGSAREFYYQHYDLGYFYNLQTYLNVGGGYRHIYELKKGKFKLENEPYLTAALLWDFQDFKFEDRNRLEYRQFDFQPHTWRYRNKLTVKMPWKFTKFEIQPYLADEIFLDFENAAFSRNRFSAGLSMNLTKNLKAEAYYLLQSTRSAGRWTEANVLGTKVRLAF